MKSFLFANVPLSLLHFVLFVLFKGIRRWYSLVGGHGHQLPRMGSRPLALRLPLHPQSAEVI